MNLSIPNIIQTLDIRSWKGPFADNILLDAASALENGKVIYCPQLPFALSTAEKALLTPRTLETKSKNISYNVFNKQLKGCRLKNHRCQDMKGLLSRYQVFSEGLISVLIPEYQATLIKGRTSYRPIEIDGRETSILKDDTKLHVDAFSATPTQGNRILRVFTNMNPFGQNRHWRLGEPFEEVVKHFSGSLKKPIWGSRTLLSLLKMTKSYRSLYDHYMLQLHDQMKLDPEYQANVLKQDFYFPPGATWIVMTDCVSHAALSGQYVLEQTFYLPVNGMQYPELSPLKILEQLVV
jgi:hypothetical protein